MRSEISALGVRKLWIIALLIVLLTSCMEAVSIPDDKKDYIWTWQSNEMYLNIGKDGYIDYKKKVLANETSVNWPITKFENEDFIVWILGIETKFDVQKVPFTNENWNIEMVIDWITLLKQKANNIVVNKIKIPSSSDLDKLTKETITEFHNNVKAGKFNNFHKNISDLWKKQITVTKLNELFANLIENKDIVLKSWKWKVTYKTKPSLDKNNDLLIEWSISWEVTVYFKLNYINENWKWKLFGIDVNYK